MIYLSTSIPNYKIIIRELPNVVSSNSVSIITIPWDYVLVKAKIHIKASSYDNKKPNAHHALKG